MAASVAALIRHASARDAEAIAELHAQSWRSTYRGVLADEYLEHRVHTERAREWQARFSPLYAKSFFVLLAEVNSRVAGFSCVFPNEDTVFGSFLDNLHVAPERVGQGIGRHLLTESVRQLLARGSSVGLYLWVLEPNRQARRFYARAGGAETETKMLLMPDGNHIAAVRCYWPDPARLLP